jgi:Predicted Zn-dependent protease (DUF2268)
MKTVFLVFLFLIGCRQLEAQQSFQYNDYFHYRNHLYLQTPSIFLNAAGLKAMAKDTAASVYYIIQAAKTGLFDTMFITTNSRIQYITKRKEWSSVKQLILNNVNSCTDPVNMHISFSDIDNFWKIYDRIDVPGGDSLLMNEYILKGSTGLRTFFEKRMGLQANNIINHVRTKKKYFASIRNVSLNLYKYKPAMIAAAKKIKEIYPEAFFPPAYFTIGAFNAFGTADGGAGQLIGAEFLIDKNTVDTSELTAFEKYAMADTSRITGIFIHELMHSLQQTAMDNSLLARSINEGAADFITQLALGYNINSKTHVYGNAHEKELWQQFSVIMNDEETAEWLYNGMAAKGERPADLGYYIGYKICEAYYTKMADKKQAIKDILTIKDFKLFLTKSGYGK